MSSLFTFLLVVHAIVAASLVGVILMQRSEGGGLTGGGNPAGLMTARGAADFLTRATTVLATLFVALSIALSALAASNRQSKDLDTSLAAQPATAPADSGVPLITAPADAGNVAAPVAPVGVAAPAAPVPLAVEKPKAVEAVKPVVQPKKTVVEKPKTVEAKPAAPVAAPAPVAEAAPAAPANSN